MCSLAEFIVKYVLIISNIVFSLAGLAVVVWGSIAHKLFNKIHKVIPVDISFLSISIIVIGCIIFVIAFCACCGAIRESRCMLITYAVFMGILAAVKIYITVVVFKFLSNAMQTVSGWLNNAFTNNNVRPAFNVVQALFECCGTVGARAYSSIGEPVPPTCCYNPDMAAGQCTLVNSYKGCITKVGNFFANSAEDIGGVLIVIITIECVCVIFGLFLAYKVRNKIYT